MRAVVAGIERFCAFMWKGLYCDRCERPYTGPGGLRSWLGHEIRQAASENGWSIGVEDLCPECGSQP
jgi:hypothetical protein